MPAESDPYDPNKGLEAWKFTGAGKHYIAKFTGKYGEVAYVGIHGGRTFHLSPHERRYNSELCRTDEMDVFKNGTCVPVALTEDTTPAERVALESNPEIISDTEVASMFAGKGPKADTMLAEKLALISNPITLARIYEAALKADLAYSRMQLIQMRIADVTHITEDGKVMIPATNILDSPLIYGDESTIQARSGVSSVAV